MTIDPEKLAALHKLSDRELLIDIYTNTHDLPRRVDSLERWQTRIGGGVAVISGLYAVGVFKLKAILGVNGH